MHTWAMGSVEGSESIRITHPQEGDDLRETVPIRVEVSSPETILEVTFTRDGAFLEKDSRAPFEIPWNTQKEADGPHTLEAQATRTSGTQEITQPLQVTVDNHLPAVRILDLKPGDLVAGMVPIQVEAEDPVGVGKVHLLIDGEKVATLEKSPFSFQWESAKHPNGLHTLEALAVDRSGNQKHSQPISVRSTNLNRAPQITSTDPVTLPEGTTLRFTLNVVDSDGNRDPLTLETLELPHWARFDPKTGEFEGTPDFQVATLDNPSVVERIRLKACDPEPLCDDFELLVTVVNVNQPPAFHSLTDLTFQEGEKFNVQFKAEDPDGDALSYQVKRLPAWMKFNPWTQRVSGKGEFEATSQRRAKRTEIVEIEACDPEPQCVSEVFRITLLDKNRPPEIEPIGNRRLTEQENLTLRIRATDLDSDSIFLTAEPLPYGAQFIDRKDGTGELTWRPQADQSGKYEVAFQASDKEVKSARVVTLEVTDSNVSISGKVVNDRGEPYVGGTVQITRGSFSYSLTTDDRGCYLLENASPGEYVVKPLSVQDFGYSSQPKSWKPNAYSPNMHSVKITDTDRKNIDFIVLSY